jgi:hypothetical protein
MAMATNNRGGNSDNIINKYHYAMNTAKELLDAVDDRDIDRILLHGNMWKNCVCSLIADYTNMIGKVTGKDIEEKPLEIEHIVDNLKFLIVQLRQFQYDFANMKNCSKNDDQAFDQFYKHFSKIGDRLYTQMLDNLRFHLVDHV